MSSQVTLFLAGLLSPYLSSHQQDMPAMAKLFSRAHKVPGPKTVERTLHTLFQGLDKGQLPHAAISAFEQGLIQEGDTATWCFASPVECLVTHQTAYIVDHDSLNLSTADKSSLQQDLTEIMQPEGLTLIPSQHQDWLCRLESHTDVSMNDLYEVLHKNLSHCLPGGPDRAFWHRLLTECQMLLQTTAVNKQRQAKQLPLVSSLWFWGIGKLPQQVQTTFDRVYTNDSVAAGLTRLSHKQVQVLSGNAHDITFDKQHIAIIDNTFYRLLQQQSFDKWVEYLQVYEQNWFAPLLQAIAKGKISHLQLICANGFIYTVTKTNLKFFWRKIQSSALLATHK